MPDADELLQTIAAGRAKDPLAPTTVLVPSHVAALQLRRRLAEIGPFAGVRFEPLARIAELLGAGDLAAAGRLPLARPIADYIAGQVARESRGVLAEVGELPGYARVLRQLFRRLRRGGIASAADAGAMPGEGHLPEVLRLYDRFRTETAAFYDEDDLLDAAAAAVRSGTAGVVADLGAIYAFPELPPSAAAAALLDALRLHAPAFIEVTEPRFAPHSSFVIAPDPASEVREAVREVLDALASGVGLREVAIVHGASASYRPLLRDALAAAGLPALIMPGTPLIETPAGRAVLALAQLPDNDYSRTAAMDLLALAPFAHTLPSAQGDVPQTTSAWDRVSRDAGVTHGLGRWQAALDAYVAGKEDDLVRFDADDSRREAILPRSEQAQALRSVILHLAAQLEPLRTPHSAAEFVEKFSAIITTSFRREDEGVQRVLLEVEQLGTIASVGGSFTLASFVRALRANLEIATAARTATFGAAVFACGYRAAAGLRFRRVILCGAHEGGFPPGPGADALVEDRAWAALRQDHPYIEDAAMRVERAAAAARSAIAAAGDGELVWCAPLYEPGGTREFYPSPLMVEAARQHDPAIATGSALRGHAGSPWLRRGASPLAMQLRGPVIDAGELRLRESVSMRKSGSSIGDRHRLSRAARMIAARRSSSFTEWDGNLAAIADDGWLELQSAVSPTSLEKYSACGFRYLAGTLLRLNVVEEPEGREMMDAAERGTLIHSVLNSFFKEQQMRGRPVAGEAWNATSDLDRILAIADEQLADATRRGLVGLEIYAGHERRSMRADLAAFLEADSAFRQETGAVPAEFELAVPEVTIAGVRLRGYVDRIDRTPDGRRAWIIDYKTGSTYDYKQISAADPFAGGKKLQLPTYLSASDAPEAHALYWFMTRKGEFSRVTYDPTPDSTAVFESTLEAIVVGVRSGAFPAVSGDVDEFFGGFKNCNYCDFTRICSRRRDDAFIEKSGDPALAGWSRVAEAASADGAS